MNQAPIFRSVDQLSGDTIQDRIVEVLREHRFERHSASKAGYFAWWGHCTGCGVEGDRRNSNYAGWELDMRDDEARHNAELLAVEFGFTGRAND